MNLSQWLPPNIPRTYQQNEIWNAILSYRDRPLAPKGWPVTFQFSVGVPPNAATRVLILQPEYGPRFLAVITAFPFGKMFGADLDMADIGQLPATLRNCIEEGIVATFSRAIPDNRMGELRILGSGPFESIQRRSMPEELQWLAITINGAAPDPITISAGISVEAFVSVAAGGAVAPSEVVRGVEALLQMEIRYSLGSLSTTYNGLLQLKTGDVIVLPELPPDQSIIQATTGTYTFRLAEEGWVCASREAAERYRAESGLFGGLALMSNTINNSEASNMDAGDLGVVIDFDLGRTTVPLAQVQSWQPGMVVPLEPPAAEDGVEVTVRANGQIVATGDLVRIDDRIAVRLNRLVFSN
jgi:flagellar motor switch/type III secretory pathway protein FliN